MTSGCNGSFVFRSFGADVRPVIMSQAKLHKQEAEGKFVAS
jgi:hypothetical protein